MIGIVIVDYQQQDYSLKGNYISRCDTLQAGIKLTDCSQVLVTEEQLIREKLSYINF